MAKTGQMYTYDSSQNVTFPAAITSGAVNSYSILPRGNNSYNLGNSSSQWANVYAKTIYENDKTLSETYVKYSAAQSLNDTQKAQARTNIGAGTITEIKVNGASKGTSGSVNLTNMVTFASSQTATVAGTSKTTYTYNQPTGDSNTGSSNGSAYFPEGIIMGGTAASAGLVTRGICGVTTPDATTGACSKENLYINYDGDNNNNPNGRGLVINAGSSGSDLGNGVYSYCAVRGDAMKAYCDNHYASNASNTNIAKTGISASFSGSSHTHTLPDYVVKTESANTGASASSYTVLSSAKSSSSSITCSYDSTNKRLSITINSFPKEFNTVNVSSSSHTHSYTKATGTATPSKALGSTTQGGTITITDNGHVHAQK